MSSRIRSRRYGSLLLRKGGVYAIGDVASYTRGSAFDVNDAVAPLCSSILVDLTTTTNAATTNTTTTAPDAQNRTRSAYSSLWPTFATKTQDQHGGSGVGKQRYYKQNETEMQVVPIGPKGGVGVVFGWKVPSWFVWGVKSRTFMVEKALDVVAGGGVCGGLIEDLAAGEGVGMGFGRGGLETAGEGGRWGWEVEMAGMGCGGGDRWWVWKIRWIGGVEWRGGEGRVVERKLSTAGWLGGLIVDAFDPFH